jgi:hypothetical protein
LYRVQASKWVSVKTDFVAKFYKKILIELKDAKKKKETDLLICKIITYL